MHTRGYTGSIDKLYQLLTGWSSLFVWCFGCLYLLRVVVLDVGLKERLFPEGLVTPGDLTLELIVVPDYHQPLRRCLGR